MSAICRKSWPSMSATSTAGAHTVRLDNVRTARRSHLRRIDAPKLEGSSQYPCSEVSIMFMSGPHDRPIQFLRPTGVCADLTHQLFELGDKKEALEKGSIVFSPGPWIPRRRSTSK